MQAGLETLDSSLRWNDDQAALAPRVQHRQALDGEVALDRVENVGVGVEQGGEAAGGDDLTGRPISAFSRATSPSIIAT